MTERNKHLPPATKDAADVSGQQRGAGKSLLEAIADDSEGGNFEFDPPTLAGPVGPPVEF